MGIKRTSTSRFTSRHGSCVGSLDYVGNYSRAPVTWYPSGMGDFWKILIGAAAGLLAFIAGLLAWRQQLLDKRRFEVAEQALLTYGKIAQALQVLRERNSYTGMSEFIESRKPANNYRRYRAAREWQYGFPEDKQRAFNEAYKDLDSVRALANLYLSTEVADALGTLKQVYFRIREASRYLIMIDMDPNKTIDPQNQMDDPTPEMDYMPEDNELTAEQEQDLEKHAFPIRFMSDPPSEEDDVYREIYTNGLKLEKLCKPYTDLNPYLFLKRLALSLFLKYK
jgi:hypothetical protein